VQRDPIYNALLVELQQLQVAPYNVKVVSRGFVPWENADQQPAIYIVPVTEEGIYKRGLPTKWTIKLDLYVYARWKNSVVQGVTRLAEIMDGIDLILAPVGPNAGPQGDNGYVNTLGGLCSYCALQGAAQVSGGFLSQNQTIARMPVEILVA
jgi:hypothetical protein